MVEQLPYGPGTRPIRRFFQRLASLGPAEERAIVEAHAPHSRSAAYRSAEKRLAVMFPQCGRDAEWEAAMRVLIQLTRKEASVQADVPAPNATDREADVHVDISAPHATESEGSAGLATMRDISEPATAALFALMVQDLLSNAEFDALYAPFALAIPVSQLEGRNE